MPVCLLKNGRLVSNSFNGRTKIYRVDRMHLLQQHVGRLTKKQIDDLKLIFIYKYKTYTYSHTNNHTLKCSSSIQHQDSNSQPSKCKSLPLTTRPGLPPTQPHFLIKNLTLTSFSKCQRGRPSSFTV